MTANPSGLLGCKFPDITNVNCTELGFKVQRPFPAVPAAAPLLPLCLTVTPAQDPTMQLRTHAAFTKHWTDLQPSNILSFSPLQPQVCVNEQGDGLAFKPNTISMDPPVSQEQLQRWLEAQKAAAAAAGTASGSAAACSKPLATQGGGDDGQQGSLSASQGVWDVRRFLSLLLGEIPRLRDQPGGYGPQGQGFIDHVDVPQHVEEAWAWLAGRYPHLLRA